MQKQNEERVRNFWDNFIPFNIQIIGVPGEKGRARNWKLTWKTNEGELPQSGKGNRLPGSPGSPQSPKEIEPKEEHNKT